MNTVKRFAKNTVASLIYQICTPLSSFILIYFIAKYMGVTGLGQFSSGMSLLFMFQGVSSLGFSYLITREISRNKSTSWKILLNSSIIGLLFSIITVLIMCFTASLVTQNKGFIKASYILSIALVPYTLSTICESVCRGHERIEYVAIASIAGNVIRVVLGMIVLINNYGLYYLFVIIVFSYFPVLLFNIYYSLKCIPESQRLSYVPDISYCKWILISMPILALIIISSTIRINIDTLLLTKLMSDIDVGIYNGGAKLVNMFRLGASSYIMALQPIIFKLSDSRSELFQRACIDSIRYLFILLLPIILFVMLLSDKIVLLIFKKEFLPSSSVLQILIWMVLLYGMNQIFANVLISNNDQKINLFGNIISAIISIVLNIIMIPKFGYIGAGVATVLSYVALFLIQNYAVQNIYFKINYLSLLGKPLMAAITMGIIIQIFRDMHILLLALMSISSFIIVLFALKTFTQQDVDLFKKLCSKSKT